MKIHRSNNIFVPIIEINGEYYLADFVPKWWEMFFGFWRVAFFWYPAKKIEKEELSKYTKNFTAKGKGRRFLTTGIGAGLFGNSLRHAFKKIDLLFSIEEILLIMVVVHIICFSLYYFIAKKKEYQRLEKYEYKVKYKIHIRPFSRLIIYFLMTAFVFWIQLGQFKILTLAKSISNYSFSTMLCSIISIAFWWCNVIHFIPVNYGEIIVSKKVVH